MTIVHGKFIQFSSKTVTSPKIAVNKGRFLRDIFCPRIRASALYELLLHCLGAYGGFEPLLLGQNRAEFNPK